jgi:hypothetical protein
VRRATRSPAPIEFRVAVDHRICKSSEHIRRDNKNKSGGPAPSRGEAISLIGMRQWGLLARPFRPAGRPVVGMKRGPPGASQRQHFNKSVSELPACWPVAAAWLRPLMGEPTSGAFHLRRARRAHGAGCITGECSLRAGTGRSASRPVGRSAGRSDGRLASSLAPSIRRQGQPGKAVRERLIGFTGRVGSLAGRRPARR